MMKKLLATILAMMMIFSLCACGAEPAETTPTTTEATVEQTTGETTVDIVGDEKTFTVVVVHADGENEAFTYTSAEEFVGPVLQKEGLIFGNDGPYGLEIHTVDGERAVYAEDGAYWAVYVGEEYALTGIDQTPITDGGLYKLVYTNA